MLFDKFLDSPVQEQTLFSDDLWKDDYQRTAANAVGNRDVGFATLYHEAGTYYEEPLHAVQQAQICVYCHARYYEKDNIGHLRCTYHPARAREGVYLCCGRSDVRGCVRCDHTDQHPSSTRWTDANVQIRIPKLLRPIFRYPESSICESVDAVNELLSYDRVMRTERRT